MKRQNETEVLTVEEVASRPYPFCASRDDPAPVFTAEALTDDQFETINLEDYRGSWVLLFFYASDFTFV